MALPESPREYFERRDVVAEYASFDFLLQPERRILDELEPRLAAARVLDLGVGAGRTTQHLAGRVRQYVGLDYSAAMIEACRQRFGTQIGPRSRFVVGDARDLSAFEPESFDIVLFSFNGLDTVGGHEDRMATLIEVRKSAPPTASSASPATTSAMPVPACRRRRRSSTCCEAGPLRRCGHRGRCVARPLGPCAGGGSTRRPGGCAGRTP